MKRLVLNQKNRKVAGLCAGIADYLEVDVTVVRLLWLIFTVSTAVIPGVFVYAVGVAITPKEGEIHA